MDNEKINSKIKLWNNSSFVILIFVILKFQNIGRSTFRRSKFWPPPLISISIRYCALFHIGFNFRTRLHTQSFHIFCHVYFCPLHTNGTNGTNL